jgi:uncharacterized protein
MRLKSVLLTTVVSLFVGLSAQAGEPDAKYQAVLKAPGASPGGVGFVLLSAMSKVVKNKFERLEVTVVPGGFVGNIQRVNAGESDLGATTVSLAAMAGGGIPPYDKGKLDAVKALYNVQNEFNFFAIVRQDLKVDSIGDIFKKKLPVRFATLNKGTATELVWRSIFESQGVSWRDISKKWGGSVSFVRWADAVNLVKDGHADGILAVGSKKIGWAMDLANARDIKILTWDKEFLDLAKGKFGLTLGKINAGTYPGVEADVVVPFTPCQVVVNAKVDDMAVTAMLTALADGAADYAKFHPALANFKAEGMAKNLQLPLHPAAKAFYDKRGIPTK